jgi:hypothetical protein
MSLSPLLSATGWVMADRETRKDTRLAAAAGSGPRAPAAAPACVGSASRQSPLRCGAPPRRQRATNQGPGTAGQARPSELDPHLRHGRRRHRSLSHPRQRCPAGSCGGPERPRRSVGLLVVRLDQQPRGCLPSRTGRPASGRGPDGLPERARRRLLRHPKLWCPRRHHVTDTCARVLPAATRPPATPTRRTLCRSPPA